MINAATVYPNCPPSMTHRMVYSSSTGPAQLAGAILMEECDTVVAAARLAIARRNREMSPGLPDGKTRKADSPQNAPDMKVRTR